MGRFARILACSAAASVVACASLAGLEEPDPVALDDAGTGDGSLQDTGNDSSTPGVPSSDAAASDAAKADAPSDAKGDGCTLGQSADPCTKASECCSGKCGERRECVATCKASGTACDPTSTSSCCVGLWCSGGFQCTPCIASGQQAATAGMLVLPHSCCSRTLKFGTTECQ